MQSATPPEATDQILRESQSRPAPDPKSWMESAADLIASRIALIQIEAKQAATANAARLVMLVGGAFLAVLAWILTMAAVVGLLHVHAHFPWYWGCLSVGGLHLLGTAILLNNAKAPKTPAFTHTRAEFQKDREWLKNLKKPK